MILRDFFEVVAIKHKSQAKVLKNTQVGDIIYISLNLDLTNQHPSMGSYTPKFVVWNITQNEKDLKRMSHTANIFECLTVARLYPTSYEASKLLDGDVEKYHQLVKNRFD